MHRHKSTWAFVAFFALLFYFSYANQLIYGYQVPPGGDAVHHNAIVKSILAGNYSQILRYHTVWHVFIGLLSTFFHARSISLMAWLGPGLLVSMGTLLYMYNRRFFSSLAGIASLILMGFFSYQPYQTLYDGGFPNVLAAGTILPLTLLALNNLWEHPRKTWAWALFGLSFITLAYSHHLTTLYAGITIGLFLVIQVFQHLRKRGIWLTTLVPFTLVMLYGLFVTGSFLVSRFAPSSVRGLFAMFLKTDMTFPFVHLVGKIDNPNAYWPLAVYPNGIGEAVVYLGLFGFAIALHQSLFRVKGREQRGLLFLILWASVLFIASQIPQLGFPVRLARDLAIPLALLGGYFISFVILLILKRRLPLGPLLIFLFISACITIGIFTFTDRYKRAVSANPLVTHLDVDSQAADYITESLPMSTKIAVFQDDIYLNDFTPLHNVILIDGPQRVQSLTNATTAEALFTEFDYLYLELRKDREESWINNQGIIDSYRKAKSVTLVKEFKQPEKHSYLFKIRKTVAPPATNGAQ